MNTSSLRAASLCGGTPVLAAAAPLVTTAQSATMARRRPDADTYYNNCVTSRRPSQCYSEVSSSSRHTNATNQHVGGKGAGGGVGNRSSGGSFDSKHQWSSYRTDVTGTSMRTPISSGKFRTNFSFRQALVPGGYPKMEHERNPRRESFVAEFSRKLAEGYDIWEDEDRPVINWVFPRLPIRKNKTHELRMMANRERITKMLEREKQMNKRNTRLTAAAADKKETAWWERSRNAASRTPSTFGYAGGSRAVGGILRSSDHINGGWSSNVSERPRYPVTPRGSFYMPRR